MPNLQLAENLDPFLDGFLGLLTSLGLGATEDQLSDQPPFGRQAPLLSDLGIDQRVVVLQVGAKANRFKSSPDCVLLAKRVSKSGAGVDIRKYWCMALEWSAQGSNMSA